MELGSLELGEANTPELHDVISQPVNPLRAITHIVELCFILLFPFIV